MTKKIAVPLDGMPSIVVLNNGDRMRRTTALEEGYRIVDAATLAQVDAEGDKANGLFAWRERVSHLPEAGGRAAAIAQIIETQPLMSIDRVRAFLRGLPVETTTTNQTEETSMTDMDPRAARRAEIRQSMAAYNQGRGYTARATQPVVRQGTRPASPKSVEPAKLRRLAEIRLSVMDHNGKGMTEEAKRLRLALETHASVGTPLDRAFAQLHVDTTKFASSNS